MTLLNIKPAQACRYDLVSLGEVMLRLDPGSERIHTARNFRAWEGGGEYNVARGLRKCFGLKTAIVTSFVDNAVGRLLEDLILQGGVDVSLIKWVPFDGIGRTVRNGLNFTERGFGIRGALGVSDRGNTAASQLKSGDIDWEYIFGKQGVRWFHTGGIFAALSASTPDLIEEALQAARKYGTIISYDLNFRPSLWQDMGGRQKAREVNRRLARHVDVMFGIEDLNEDLSSLDLSQLKQKIQDSTKGLPNLKIVSTTLRTTKSATINDWGAICWAGGNLYKAPWRNSLEIFDRVGGGDSFASGFIYGLITKGDPQIALNYGAAHGALTMTTPGDNSMATVEEVEQIMSGGEARIVR